METREKKSGRYTPIQSRINLEKPLKKRDFAHFDVKKLVLDEVLDLLYIRCENISQENIPQWLLKYFLFASLIHKA